ncbi:unnamed protein product [Paramecium octaurelia]|uniref:Uncharacterized protein n=1 Tax=Paramecium octaurelia TaxID=43137 RepID=A0A8S1V1Z2_PAROT|nr:unnamed protein product [Paramecium octaurelia]
MISIVTCFEVNLTNLQDNYYSMPIQANDITYNLLVDTGNEEMWIFGKNSNRKTYYQCEKCVPTPNKTYDKTEGRIFGVEYNQTFVLMNQSLTLQVIEASKVEHFYSIIADGAIGLSRSQLSKEGNLLRKLYDSKVIDQMQFGLLLNEQNCQPTSILILGTPIKHHYINELQYVKTLNSQQWMVKGSSVEIVGKNNKKELESSSQIIVFDSGEPKILISRDKFNKLITIFNENYNLDCQKETSNQINEIVCSYNEQSFPELNINIDTNLSLTLLPQDYIASCEYNYYLQHKCLLNFQQIDNTDVLVLGIVFLQKYYIHYDINTFQIGIAKSIYYQRDKLNQFRSTSQNNSMLYFSLFLVLILLIAIYIVLRMLLKKSMPLYLSVLEKSSSRSQEQEMEAITFKTQSNSQPPLSSQVLKSKLQETDTNEAPYLITQIDILPIIECNYIIIQMLVLNSIIRSQFNLRQQILQFQHLNLYIYNTRFNFLHILIIMIKYSQCGEYNIIEKLGDGYHSKVKLGEKDGKKVAIKIFKKKHDTPSIIMTLANEIKILKLLQHPNVINLIEYGDAYLYRRKNGQVQKRICLILELASGGELFHYVATSGPFAPEASRYYFKQILSAMIFMQNKGICHRDLKLQNVLLDENFNIKIADFGFAKIMDAANLSQNLGTPGYKAPEIEANLLYNGTKADIFSVGVILFILNFRFPPFKKATEQDSHYKLLITNNNVKFWQNFKQSNKNIEFNNDLINLLDGMLAPDPNKRITLDQCMEHPWTNGPVATPQQIQYEFKQKLEKIQAFAQATKLQLQAQMARAKQNQGEYRSILGEPDQENFTSTIEQYNLDLDKKTLKKGIVNGIPNEILLYQDPNFLFCFLLKYCDEFNSKVVKIYETKYKINFKAEDTLNETILYQIEILDCGDEMIKLIITKQEGNYLDFKVLISRIIKVLQNIEEQNQIQQQ